MDSIETKEALLLEYSKQMVKLKRLIAALRRDIELARKEKPPPPTVVEFD